MKKAADLDMTVLLLLQIDKENAELLYFKERAEKLSKEEQAMFWGERTGVCPKYGSGY